MFKLLNKLLVAVTFSILAALPLAHIRAESTLSLEVFNPGSNSLFPISSVLITGPTEALLVDAQFQRNDARTLVNMIKESGKKLTAIYISHGDPDFYFGLDVIKAAFPNVKILTSPRTHQYIKTSMQPKLDYWGPILKENAPKELIVPDIIQGDTLYVDGQEIKVIGLNGHDPKHTYLWIPSAKTILGGVLLYENMHAWIADTQTPESRQKWYRSLDEMQALQPNTVIPGHFLGKSSQTEEAINFTRQYVQTFETATASASNADELIAKLKQRYPGLKGETELDISAKVIMGEMSWP